MNGIIMKKAIVLLIAISTVLSLTFAVFAVTIPDTSFEVSEKKIICNASIDEDFSDSRVLVVMNADVLFSC